jgi:oleate hydratase
MIRDGGVAGSDITIFEALPLAGGSLDGGGNADTGYTLRGGRMLTTDNYECTWDLFKSIPSLEHPGRLRRDLAFNEANKSHSHARLVDRNRFKLDVTPWASPCRTAELEAGRSGRSNAGQQRHHRLAVAGILRHQILVHVGHHFAFQPWHSAVEFKRYLHRFMMEFSRIETLAGVKRTVYNQYDSLVRPLQHWLQQQGVQVVHNCTVDDIELEETASPPSPPSATRSDGKAETSRAPAGPGVLPERFDDGCLQLRQHAQRAAQAGQARQPGLGLVGKAGAGRPQFGNPAAFNSSIPESWWESFTVTLKAAGLLRPHGAVHRQTRGHRAGW